MSAVSVAAVPAGEGQTTSPPDPYRRFRETRFFGSLDGLRALSILGVIWFHCWYQTPWYDWLTGVPLLRNGWFGVDVFFTISGFLITTLLLRERDRHGAISLPRFYARRVLRIMPLYYSVLAGYVVLTLLRERGTPDGRAFMHALPGFLTFTYTWLGQRPGEPVPHFHFAWSLCTEEQFYLLWPFALRFLRRPWPQAMMAALVAVALASHCGWFGGAAVPPLARRVAQSIAPAICGGALLAQFLHTPGGFASAYRVLGRRWSAPAALGLLALVVASSGWLGGAWAPLTWAVLPLFVGACVVREDNGLAPVLRLSPLVHGGVLSYGMYLFNTACVKVSRPAMGRLGLGHPALVFPVATGLTALVAWVSYRYFESVFLSLKEPFSRLRPLPHTPATGVESAAGVSIHP